MKESLKPKQVEGIKLAVVLQKNEIYKTDDWNVYLINEKDQDLEMVLILVYGFNETQKTAPMRHKMEKLPAQSVAKIEFIEDSVLKKLDNYFKISFFLGNEMFEKEFVITRDTVNKSIAKPLDLFNREIGVVLV
jgi:hypothetical protein